MGTTCTKPSAAIAFVHEDDVYVTNYIKARDAATPTSKRGPPLCDTSGASQTTSVERETTVGCTHL